MKKFLLTLLVIVLLLVSVFIYFATRAFNADNFQQQIEQSVLDLTGKKLTIHGTTTLNWRPMPTITIENVSLANHAGSEHQNMMTADTISVEIEWASLFKSPLKIKNVTLKNPTFILEKLKTNQTNWNLPFLSTQTKISDNISAVITEDAMTSTQIESVQIKNGSLRYENHVNNLTFQLSDINGELSMTSLKGPFTFSGDVIYQNNTFGLGVQVEQIKEDLPIRFTAQLSEHKSDFVLKLTGSSTPHLTSSIVETVGEFTLKKPNTFLKLMNLPEIPTAVNQPSLGNFTVESSLLKDHLKNLTMRIGENESALSLTVDLEFKKKTAQEQESFLGDFAINRLDYEVWKPLLSKLNWDFIGGKKTIPYTDLKIHIPELIYRKQPVKNVETILTYANGAMLISDGKAVLPGENNALNFSGIAMRRELTPELKLDVKSTLKSPTAIKPLLNLTQMPDAVKSMDLNVALTIHPTDFSIAVNTFKLNNSTITGYLNYDYTKEPLLNTALSVSNLDIDTYFKPAEKTEKTVLHTLPALIRQQMAKYPILEKANAIFDIKGTNITWHRLPMAASRLSGNISKGTLDLTNFEIRDMATSNLKLTGRISGFGSAPIKTDKLALTFSAKQLGLFLNRAQLDSRFPLIKDAENVQFMLSLSGEKDKWQIDSKLKLSDTMLGAVGTLYNKQSQFSVEKMAFNVSAPKFKPFLAAVNLPTDTFKNLDGNFTLSGTVNGTLDQYKLSNLIFNVGTERLTGALDVENKNLLKVKGNLSTTLLNAERFVPGLKELKNDNAWNANIINFDALNAYELDMEIQAKELTYDLLSLENGILKLTLKDKLLTLAEFSGKHKKAPNSLFKITGQLNWLNTPTLQGKIDLQRIPMRTNFLSINSLFLGDGSYTVNGEVKTSGRSVAQMIKNLNGTGQFETDNNIIIGMDLNQVQTAIEQSITEQYTTDVMNTQIKRALSSGKSDLVHSSGKWDIAQGIIQAPNASAQTDVSLSNPTQITWNLPQQSLDIVLPIKFKKNPELPTITATLKQIGSQSSYTVDIDMLSNALTRQIMQVLEKNKLAETQQQNMKKEIEKQSKQDTITQAVKDAENAVQRAEQLSLRSPSERTTLLVQNAKDALSFVKTLSIKQTLTDTQYNQLMEQSRLAVLRAQEAESEILKNDLLETRRNILALSQYTETVLKQMESLQEKRPYIDAIKTAVEQVRSELKTINNTANVLIETTDLEQINQSITTANQAFQRVQEQYESVKRFDPTIPISADDVEQTAVQGNFSRKTGAQ